MSQGNRVSPSPTSSPDHRVDTHQLQEIGHDRGSPHGQRNTLEDEDNIIGERGTPEDSSNQSHHYDDDFHTDDGSVRKDSPDVQLTNHDDAIKSPDLQTTNQDGEAIGRESPDIQLPVLADETESENVITYTTDKAPGESEYKDQGYERIYTPALPKADTLEESHYDLATPPPTYQEDSTLSETPPRFPPEKRISELNQSYKQSGTHILPPIGANRITPVDQATVHRAEVRQRLVEGQRSGGDSQVYNVSHEVLLERKKSLIIGADGNTDGAGCCGWLLYIFSILLIIISLPFSLMLTIKVVQEYERAVIFRLGRLPLGGAKGPGIFFIIPCIESYSKVDLRTVSFDVPPQEVLTKDSVTVSVDAVVYYRVSNPTVSVANVENAHHSTRLLAQTTLRNILGTKNMSEILSDRESISVGMQSTLDSATDRWGIKVERVEIKDVRLPVQLQRAMAAEAEAAREARAKVIAAEGEHKASRALKEAADVMGQSSSALQLRYLQTLSSISAEKNSTIIFPLPIDMLQSFMKKGK